MEEKTRLIVDIAPELNLKLEKVKAKTLLSKNAITRISLAEYCNKILSE